MSNVGQVLLKKIPITHLQLIGIFYCDRDRIQTCNPHIRSVVLYSVELRSHFFTLASAKIMPFFEISNS